MPMLMNSLLGCCGLFYFFVLLICGGDCNHDSLAMDQAWMTFYTNMSNNNGDLQLFMLSDACYKCNAAPAYSHGKQVVIHNSRPTKIKVNTTFPTTLYVKNVALQTVCSGFYTLNEGWRYHYMISNDVQDDLTLYNCLLVVVETKATANLPIYIGLGILVAFVIIWYLISILTRRYSFYHLICCQETDRLINSDLGTPTSSVWSTEVAGDGGIDLPQETCAIHTITTPIDMNKRLQSLDTFRGISIVLMIFVNYGGGGYWFFKHAAWNGLTVADLVFPWFIFIMGTSTAFSFKGQLRSRVCRWKIFLKVLRRSATLFILGLVINTGAKHNDILKLRIPGVLQRFSLVYLVVAGFYLIFAHRIIHNREKWWSQLRDVFNFWPEWLVQLGLLATNVCLTFLLKVPGCPTGYLGPGGLHDNSLHYNCTGGVAGFIDRTVFGEDHIYQHPSSWRVYNGKTPYDPEGLLGTLTSIFLCFLGLQAGKIIVIFQSHKHRLLRWLIWSVIMGTIAAILTKVSKENGWIPISKNLWSVSFVLCTACFSFILLSICYMLVDVFKIWSGAPFHYAGMNAIFLYMGHEILSDRFPISFKVPNNHASQLAMDVWGTTFWVLVGYVLYRKKIFYSI